MPIVYRDMIRGEPRLGTDIPSSRSDVLTETFAQTFEENPIRAVRRWNALREDEQTGPTLDAAAARQKLKDAGLESHLKVNDAGITQAALDTLMERKRTELRRQDIFSRAQGGAGEFGARLGLSIATTLADPISAGLNFVPVVGQVRYARWLAKAGSMAGRIGVRAAVGAAEGAVGAAITEPFIYSMRTQEQADYDTTDSLLNVALGGITGAGLHATVGSTAEIYQRARGLTPEFERYRGLSQDDGVLVTQFLKEAPKMDARDVQRVLDTWTPEARAAVADVLPESSRAARAAELPADIQRAIFEPEGITARRVDALPPEVQHAALRAAVGQAVEGRPIDVENIIGPQINQTPIGRGGVITVAEGASSWGGAHPRWPEIERATEEALAAEAFTVHQTPQGDIRLVNLQDSDGGIIRAINSEGQNVGSLFFSKGEQDGLRFNPDVEVEPSYRRAGIASAMYDLAESSGGLIPRLDQPGQLRSEMGEAFRRGRESKSIGSSGRFDPRSASPTAPGDTEFRAASERAEAALANEPDRSTSEANLKAAEEEAQLAVSDAKALMNRLGQEFTDDDIAEGLEKAERWARVAELATVCLVRGD